MRRGFNFQPQGQITAARPWDLAIVAGLLQNIQPGDNGETAKEITGASFPPVFYAERGVCSDIEWVRGSAL